MKKPNPLFFFPVLIIGYIIAIIILAYLDIQTVFEPPFLLTTLNTIFTGLIPLVIAWIAARTYLKGGQSSVFWLGGGMLVFGLGSIAAGWMVLLPDSSNIIVTIHNTCVFLSSVFYLIGALYHLFSFSAPKKETKRKVSRLLLFYTEVLVGTILLAYAAINRLTPPFFIQGGGATLLRSIVLLLAMVCFTFSASVFLDFYVKSKSLFFYWNFVAMSMIAVGLVAIFLMKSVGTPLSWLGRSAQYLGSMAALAAIVSAQRSSRKLGETIEDTLANFFSEAEMSYQNLVTMASEAIISFDQRERIVLWNKAAEKIFGYSAQEAIGLPFFETVLLEPYDSLRKTIAQMAVLDGLLSKGMDEWQAKRRGGSRFPVEFTYTLQKLQPGWVVTFILRDISERKQAEEAQRESDRAYHALVDNIPGAVFRGEVYPPWRTIKMSAGMEALSGYPINDFLDGNILYTNFTLPEDLEKFSKALQGGIDEKRPYEVEYRIRHRDGSIRWMHEKGQIICSDQGEPLYMDGVIIDITERKLVEEALIEAQKSTSLGQMAAGVAHEINSPLQVITGLSERIMRQLERGQLDEARLPQDIATINRVGWNMAKIIRSLLTYARESKGQAALQDLNEIIQDTLLLTEHQFKTWVNIQITSDLEENMPALYCERNQIAQVLINLMANARDAMPEGGDIVLRTRYQPKQQRFVIHVSDTGCGMTPEVKNRIFDPFFTTKPVGDGTGLGLPVVLGIIKTHGGDIDVESSPKKGTTITIHLPEKPQTAFATPVTSSVSGRYDN